MVNRRLLEIAVGLFMLAAIAALVVLAFRVSGLTTFTSEKGYTLTAVFDNIGNLKIRAPVAIAGVKVGEVTAIHFDPKTFQAVVSLHVGNTVKVPSDTSASILTQGLLGASYIGLTPGYSEQSLKQGGQIQTTHSALVLENLISQFLFSAKSK